jgi:glutamyl-tRNA reductase
LVREKKMEDPVEKELRRFWNRWAELKEEPSIAELAVEMYRTWKKEGEEGIRKLLQEKRQVH